MYCAPKCPTIVKVCVGPSAYNVHHVTPQTQVVLVEKNVSPAALWNYPLKQATVAFPPYEGSHLVPLPCTMHDAPQHGKPLLTSTLFLWT